MKNKYLKIGAIVIAAALVLSFVFVTMHHDEKVNNNGNGSDVQISGENDTKEEPETNSDNYYDVDLEESSGLESNDNTPEDKNQSTQNSGQPDNGSPESNNNSQGNQEGSDTLLSNGPLELPTDVFE